MTAQTELSQLLARVDIRINGTRPWDIHVHNQKFYSRILSQGSLGLGESYMDGWWDCAALDELFFRLIRSDLRSQVRPWRLIFPYLYAKIFNGQRTAKAFTIGEMHYDIGNDLYSAMLDKRLTYTCGYWKNAKNLDQAQEAKLELVCRKIGLKKGQRVLDIGCGWGSFASYAAQKYGARVVGITVSKEQVVLARKLCKGLPVEIRLQDYREMNGNEKFDHIVSLGMFEHVGPKNYQMYMEIADRCLKDDGFFLLHTIGSKRSLTIGDPWISKYIFPGAVLPSITQIGKSIERLFVMEDWHNFGSDYDKTLMAWFTNFDRAWPKLKSKYDERFYRMWKYYLLACAGSFRARHTQLWQIVLSKKGVIGGYKSIR